jgi:hypothetical protein
MNKGHGNLSFVTCESGIILRSCILKSRWFVVAWEGRYTLLHLLGNSIKTCHSTENRVQTIDS